MITQKLALYFSLFLLRGSILVNKTQICNEIKTVMNKTITIFESMTTEDRERLFTFSIRNLTLNLMELVEFTDEELNRRRTELVRSIESLRQKYQRINSKKIVKLNKIQRNLNSQHDVIMEKYKQTQIESKRNVERIKDLRDSLESTKRSIESKYQNMGQKVQRVRALDNKMVIFFHTKFDSNFYPFALDEVESVLDESDAGVQKEIDFTRTLLDDFLLLKKLADSDAKVQRDIKLEYNRKVYYDLKAINKKVRNTGSSIRKSKKRINKMLNKKLNVMKQELNRVPEYKAYQALVAEVKKERQLQNQLKRNKVENLNQMNVIMHNLRLQELHTLRLFSDRIDQLEINLDALANLREAAVERSPDFNVKNPKLKSGIDSFYRHNKTRKDEIQRKYERAKKYLEKLQNLQKSEGALDDLFGRVFAFLQNGPETSKCFINMEISSYLYYMSLFQMIVSKEAFLTGFLENLHENEQMAVIKNIYLDLNMDPFQDSRMIDPRMNEFKQDGLERSIKNLDFLLNMHFIKVFENQIMPNWDIQKVIFNLVLKYVGITKDILVKTIDISISEILLNKINYEIIKFVKSFNLYWILQHFFQMLLSMAAQRLFNWFYGKISNIRLIFHEILQNFYKLYKWFTFKEKITLDIDNLFDNFEPSLDENASEINESAIFKIKDRTMHFKFQFEQILLINSSTKYDYFQNNQSNFII